MSMQQESRAEQAGRSLREAVRAAHLADEPATVGTLVAAAALDRQARTRICEHAADIIRAVRSSGKTGIMETFLGEYGLSTKEGIALMCLAEAMLRIPDASTVDELIRDKITPHDWASHIGDSGSILVNASTWALMLTGRVLEDDATGIVGTLHGLVRRLGEPVIRHAVGQAMAEMGNQFVLGRTIEEAMARGEAMVGLGYTYSYDMLGEAARTDADAIRYHAAYTTAIEAVARGADTDDIGGKPGISVKLSALHPRYERSQRETMLPVLAGRLLALARAAKAVGIGLNIDAEEADRLELSLDVIEAVLCDPSLAGWDGFGVVVQTYGQRAGPMLDWLYGLAETLDRRIMVRLVKGAYWDTEIKRAQVMGLANFPVFTRKAHTDISYLAGARKLLGMTDRVYPQFATHNAHSVAAILAMAGSQRTGFEFQRLHGMGEALYDIIRNVEDINCRIYAPVGAHADLLAYLVRRLLENGANSSFVNQIVDLAVPAEEIARDPIALVAATAHAPHPAITRPADIFLPRKNSAGFDLSDLVDLERIERGRAEFAAPYRWETEPLCPHDHAGSSIAIRNPAVPDDIVGNVTAANAALATEAVGTARQAQPAWQAAGAAERAAILRRAADLYEDNAFEILALVAREAGKTLLDGVAELREAVDFLRYYADEAERAGDSRPARGVIICISPWNFPLAIFSGQIAAALAAGNAVIAKPAEQTPLIAFRAVQWMREAGVPEGVIQLLPGDGAAVGAPLTADPRIDGVCFTGSTDVAKLIDRQLAETAPDAMLIAETGGINAMIVDSTALQEQAVRDIVRSAFQSAGQRCSALRVLYVQEEIEESLLEMLSGALDALTVGDPWRIATDVGPVIDQEAADAIRTYCAAAESSGAVIKHLPVPERGLFVPPTIIRVAGIEDVEREVFGPVLHVARFASSRVDDVIEAINGRGYGLTFGLHTRIDRRVQGVVDTIHVGNLYVNRDQIGAVVGSQPFGGHGLSGTGPKAGGPNYLPSFQKPAGRSPAAPAPAGRPVALAAAREAIAGLDPAGWRVNQNLIGALRAALRGKSAAAMAVAAGVEFGPVDLPGPTGESNQFMLMPRGIVACLGPDPDTLLAQCLQALAAGNVVLAVSPGAPASTRLLDKDPFPLIALDGDLSAGAVGDLPIDAVACAVTGERRQALRAAMSRRPGPILPLISEVVAPVAYCTEFSICIDTTAAGGNASLLSQTG